MAFLHNFSCQRPCEKWVVNAPPLPLSFLSSAAPLFISSAFQTFLVPSLSLFLPFFLSVRGLANWGSVREPLSSSKTG